MNVQIHTKEITLTDNTREHVNAAIENFQRYSLDITTVNVHLNKEKQGVSVEFDIHIAHNTPVVINQNDEALDAAIDLAIERANKALRRLHDKVKDNNKTSIKDMETVEA